MKRKLPPISELEHISSEELGQNLDAVLERIDKEDIALIIDSPASSYVLCPAEWFIPDRSEMSILLTCSLRYAMGRDTHITSTIQHYILDYLPLLHTETVRNLLVIIDEQLAEKENPSLNAQWLNFKAQLRNHLDGGTTNA